MGRKKTSLAWGQTLKSIHGKQVELSGGNYIHETQSTEVLELFAINTSECVVGDELWLVDVEEDEEK